MRFLSFVFATLFCASAAAVNIDFAWDAQPDYPPGVTYDLYGNDESATGITNTTHSLDIPGSPGDPLSAGVRAVPPTGYQCGDPPEDCLPSPYATLETVIPGLALLSPVEPENLCVDVDEGEPSVAANVTLVQSKESFDTVESTSESVTLDSSPTEGNLLVAIAYHRQAHQYDDFSMSGTGWTERLWECCAVDDPDCGCTANSSYRRAFIVYTKVAGASESATVTVNHTNLSFIGLSVLELSTSEGSWTFLESASSNTGLSAATSVSTGTTASVSGYSDYLKLGIVIARMSSYTKMGTISWTNSLANEYRSVHGFYNGIDVGVAFIEDTSGGAKTSTASYTNSLVTSAGILVFGLVASGGYTLDAAGGSYSISGGAANLEFGRKLSAGSGSYSVSGAIADLLFGRKVSAESGSYNLVGDNAILLLDRVLSAESGSYDLSGTDAALLLDRVLSAEAGVYSVSGTEASLLRDFLLSAEAGAYTLTGADVTLDYSGSGQAYTLTAESGSYTVSGTAAGLLLDRVLSAEAGAYAISGEAADILRTYLLNAQGGAYNVLGQDIDFSRTYILQAESGDYLITGADADLRYFLEGIIKDRPDFIIAVSKLMRH